MDDDGDGRIDEGFDGDGIADCLDAECDVAPVVSGEVEIDEDCSDPVIVVTDPWDLKVEWEYTSSGSGSVVMPAVGNLTDDNGDGVIDNLDDPDIAFTTLGTATARPT